MPLRDFIVVFIGGILLGSAFQACGDPPLAAYGNGCSIQLGMEYAFFGTQCPAGEVMTGLLNGQLICSQIYLTCY